MEHAMGGAHRHDAVAALSLQLKLTARLCKQLDGELQQLGERFVDRLNDWRMEEGEVELPFGILPLLKWV